MDARAGAARGCAGSCAMACGEVDQAQVSLGQIAGDVLCLAREPGRFAARRYRCAAGIGIECHRRARCGDCRRDRLIELDDRLRRLLRKAQGFEAKSERLAKLRPDQLNLALADLEQTIAKAEAIEATTQQPMNRGNGGSTAARCRPICRAFTRTVAPADTNCQCGKSRCT